MRRAKQWPIESIGPCVIRTLNCRHMAVSVFDKSRSAMATHVVKPVNLSAFIPNNDQALASDVCGKIITSLRDLTLMPDQHPLLREDVRLLLRKNLRRNKIALSQRLGTSGECLSRLAKCSRYPCLRRLHLGNSTPHPFASICGPRSPGVPLTRRTFVA